MRKPDFFIVGAPKSATTSMNHYLAEHPDIFMAPKEMHYFGSDLRWRAHYYDRGQYLRQFARVSPEKKAGEASVWYLYSELAAAEIHKFQPDARIIIMLRNPVEMLYSNHMQLVRTGDEDLLVFEDALDAEAARRVGRRVPKTDAPGLIQALLYTDTARYADQVKRYLDRFGRDQVHVVIYEDFLHDTARSYQDVLEFLGADPGFSPNFTILNANRKIRWQRLWTLIKFAPIPVKRVWRAALPAPIRARIIHAVDGMYMKEAPLPRLKPETRVRLQRQFAPDVDRLSELLGRDLTHWITSGE